MQLTSSRIYFVNFYWDERKKKKVERFANDYQKPHSQLRNFKASSQGWVIVFSLSHLHPCFGLKIRRMLELHDFCLKIARLRAGERKSNHHDLASSVFFHVHSPVNHGGRIGMLCFCSAVNYIFLILRKNRSPSSRRRLCIWETCRKFFEEYRNLLWYKESSAMLEKNR